MELAGLLVAIVKDIQLGLPVMVDTMVAPSIKEVARVGNQATVEVGILLVKEGIPNWEVTEEVSQLQEAVKEDNHQVIKKDS